MHRTTIMLPEPLKDRAVQTAGAQEISLGELIRRAVEEYLARVPADPAQDPFFADTDFYDGPVPSGLAQRHDDFLYGGGEEPLYGRP